MARLPLGQKQLSYQQIPNLAFESPMVKECLLPTVLCRWLQMEEKGFGCLDAMLCNLL